MSMTPALLIPWYWELVQRLQGVIDTRPKQFLATLALPAGFVVTVFVIYRGGKPLKRRFADELVEIARTLTIMFVALVEAILFVVIWRRFGETLDELDAFVAHLVPDTGTAVNLYIAFIVLLGTYMLTRVTKRVIRYWSEHDRISPHQRELAHHLVQITLFLVVGVFIIGLFGFPLGDIFLGAGVLGVVLGLAARQTLANVLSGLIILFGRPFQAGDWIRVGDREGIVTDITVFNTQIRTFNEEHLLIPNDVITSQEVVNYSKTERLRLTTEVGIDYDDDVSKAATIAKHTMEDCDAVADSPNPDVILESFGDSEVLLRLRYWISRPTIQRKLSAQNEVIEAVKQAFEAENVKIPFPQRELMGRESTDGLEVVTDTEVTDEERIERAVRRVGEDDADGSTAVSEPVQAKYGGDGEAAEPDGEAAEPDGEAADSTDGEPVEEPVQEDYAEDAATAGETGEGDADGDGAAGEHDLESAAQLVEDDEADVSSPHPRDQGTEIYPATEDDTLREPVEDDYGRRSGAGEADTGEGEDAPSVDDADRGDDDADDGESDGSDR